MPNRVEGRRRGAVRQQPTHKPARQGKQAQPQQKASSQKITPQKGAERHRIKFSDARRSWIRNHMDVAGNAYHRLWSSPLSTLMTLAVLAIALALPGALLAGLKNLHGLSESWGADPRISLYLHTHVTEAKAEQVSRALLLRDDLSAVELISKEQGLLEFRRTTGLDDVLQYLSDNPLPTVIVVLPRGKDATTLPLLREQLAELPEVEEAVLDMAWVQRLTAFVAVSERGVIVFGALLALAVLMVVGNTIRLLIENRRDEIVVAKLVGATNAWVRRPFLYTGAWFGLLGGVIAWVLVQVSLMLLEPPVAQLAELYESQFEILGLGWLGSLLLILVSTLLGLAGAWLAVGRHLREVEPR